MAEGPRVYVETSVIGFLTTRPSVRVTTASKQLRTLEWWAESRPHFELCCSRLVVNEASRGDPGAAAKRLERLAGIPWLPLERRALDLADRLVERSGLPPSAKADALHMAVSAVHGVPFLLTWNCRHIANATLRPRINEICDSAGYRAPIMCTPEELRHG